MNSRACCAASTLVLFLSLSSAARAADYSVQSPAGNVKLTVTHEPRTGVLTYKAQSAGTTVIESSALGIATSVGDFGSGLKFLRQERREVNESYRLPVGKRSTYLNRARELELTFSKGPQELHLVLRAYDEGIAFRYAIPGNGPVEISGESTAFALGGGNVAYWGQAHPNNYGYESVLGPLSADRISMPVLAELKDRKHFVLVAQAGSYGTYVIPNYKRSEANVLALSFPLDQREPVKTTLPFASPWRFAILSPGNVGKIVESTLVENLNPPTEPGLVDAPWVRPGRASWDFIAGDGDKLRTWIDFDAQMGWEWHVADAGWQRRVPNMAEITAYGKTKGVSLMAWGKVANRDALNTPERAEAWMAEAEKLGLGGAKLDFFDQRDTTAEATDDLEDTQQRLQVRDFLSEIAARHHLVVEYHGCAIPSGERRRWPHLMSAEAIAGLEKRNQNVPHDLTIPYVRNIMGPVSFTPVHLTRSAGSYAYQLAQAVIYEAGIQIFAERHDRILAFEGVELLKAVPSAWDEIHFIDGYPASHAVFARRKGTSWFVGGITGEARTATVPLGFLAEGTSYQADVYRDGDSKTALVRESKTVTRKDTLTIPMLAAGGFALQLKAR